MQQIIEMARDAAVEESYVEVLPVMDQIDREIPNKNFYDELRFPLSPQSLMSLSRTVKKAMKAETERSIATCAIALKRYSILHGKSPTSLDSLVTEFLPSLPVDYMDGKPLKYRRNADGGFTLYSVGEDGKDDGGDASLLPDKTGSRNRWSRKDFIWPAPALPEEVEVWRREAAKN